MKLSQDLYDAGVLRRQRTGPSDDWAFDEPSLHLSRIASGMWGRVRRLFAAGRSRSRAQSVRRVRNAPHLFR